jgi:hypothetical protein
VGLKGLRLGQGHKTSEASQPGIVLAHGYAGVAAVAAAILPRLLLNVLHLLASESTPFFPVTHHAPRMPMPMMWLLLC